jgi:hypothetical protein
MKGEPAADEVLRKRMVMLVQIVLVVVIFASVCHDHRLLFG